MSHWHLDRPKNHHGLSKISIIFKIFSHSIHHKNIETHIINRLKKYRIRIFENSQKPKTLGSSCPLRQFWTRISKHFDSSLHHHHHHPLRWTLMMLQGQRSPVWGCGATFPNKECSLYGVQVLPWIAMVFMWCLRLENVFFCIYLGNSRYFGVWDENRWYFYCMNVNDWI